VGKSTQAVQHEWQASYLDGRTAVRRDATVRLMREGLEITTRGAWTRFWPYGETRQTQGSYAGEEIRLERGGALPETLVIADADFLSSLREIAPHVSARFHDPAGRSRRLRLTMLAGLAVLIITGGIYLWGIPALAAVLATRVPIAWEENLGRAVVDHLAPAAQRCDEPRLQEAIATMVGRLTAAAPGTPYTVRVIVADQPTVNAFATPGGTIVLFRGLLEQTGSPEELAGVLAHELQHVFHRDTTRALIQHASTGLLLAALTGDVTGPLAYGLQSARALGQLRYSRQAEEEADADGIRLLAAAGIDPAGMIAFFDVLARHEGPLPAALGYLSTHPSSADRITRLTALAGPAPEPAGRLLAGADWPAIKRLCRR